SALDQVGSILRIYPSQIHQKLSEAARKMDLGALIDGMNTICTMLADLYLDEDITRGFSDDVNELYRLIHLVGDHGRWQSVDALLDQIEHNLNQNDFALLWDMLKAQAEPLCSTSSDSWARFLRERAVLLEQAIRDQDAPSVARHILSYH